MATARTKRRSELELSFFSRFAGPAAGRLRRRDRGGIGMLVSGEAPQVKPGWQIVGLALCAAAMQQPSIKRLDELFAAEPGRLSNLTFTLAGIYFDWSKTHLDQELIGKFVGRAEAMGFARARNALFAGDVVNASEIGRARV